MSRPPPGLLGDVVLCPQVAARQARDAGHSTTEELLLLTTHGILHLLGYDHAEPEEEKEMFGLQRRLLLTFLSEPMSGPGRLADGGRRARRPAGGGTLGGRGGAAAADPRRVGGMVGPTPVGRRVARLAHDPQAAADAVAVVRVALEAVGSVSLTLAVASLGWQWWQVLALALPVALAVSLLVVRLGPRRHRPAPRARRSWRRPPACCWRRRSPAGCGCPRAPRRSTRRPTRRSATSSTAPASPRASSRTRPRCSGPSSSSATP